MSKLRAYFIEEFLAGKALTPVQLSTREGPPRLAMPNINVHVRQVGAPEDRTLEFVGSDESLDRYEEIISVAGWDLKNYRLNPVLLFGHDYHEPAIGHAVKVWKNLEAEVRQLLFHQKFAKAETYPFADTIYRLYLDGDMRTASVGFLPWDWTDYDEDGEAIKQLAQQLGMKWGEPKGKPETPIRIYTKHDLLELSLVPVPANPNALVNAMQRGILREAEFNLLTKKYRMPAEREVIDLSRWASLREPERVIEVERFREEKPPEVEAEPPAVEKGVVPFSAHGSLDNKFPEGTAWDAAAARARMRKWAGVDAEEAPASTWTKYRQGHAWFDSAAADTLGAYKLPHHDIMDGALAHHWRGTVAAMTALLGGRGGVDIPESDRKGIYNHLAKEYAIFSKEPPEFKSCDREREILAELKRRGVALPSNEPIGGAGGKA